MPIGENGGFVNFTGNFNFRGATNRMRSFGAQIFTGYNSVERVADNAGFDLLSLQTDVDAIQGFAQSAGLPADVLANVNSANSISDLQGILNYDNTDTELGFRNLDRSDFNMRVGNSELRGGQFLVTSKFRLVEKVILNCIPLVGSVLKTVTLVVFTDCHIRRVM